MTQLSKDVVIKNELGVHARPAALIVQSISTLKCDVLVEYNGEKVNAKSIMGILMLAIEYGKEIKIHACGEHAQKAIEILEELIESKFGEE